jgi:PKD repeat protein
MNMKNKLYKILFSLNLLLACNCAYSQTLFVDNQGYTAQSMVQDWFNYSCVSVSNITYLNDTCQLAFFDGSQSNIGLNAGLLLSSGSIHYAVGPNYNTGATGVLNALGDNDLDSLTTAGTNDAAVLEFDLVSSQDTIRFKYVFGSEEYPEWVGSSFNDVFGFFLSGPNPAGGNYVAKNIAFIPNTNLSVAINNVNATANAQYYVNNQNGQTVEYVGFTTPLEAWALVVPDSTYHIKIAVADAGDWSLDSGVFLSIESLCGSKTLPVQANFATTTVGNTVSFQNLSKYASHFSWDFGDGTTSTEKNPSHTFANLSGESYKVSLSVSNFCCSDMYQMNLGNTDITSHSFSDVCAVYPNPSNGKISLSLKNNSKAKVFIEDITGRVLMIENIQNEKTIDISGFGAGVYFLRLASAGKTYVTKIINY